MNPAGVERPSLARFAVYLLAASVPLDVTVIAGEGRSVTSIVGAVASAVVIIAVIARARVRPMATGHLVLLLYLGWNALSYFWSIDRDETLVRMVTVAQLVILVWAVWQEVRTAEQTQTLLFAFLLGAFVVALATIQDYVAGVTIKEDEVRYAALGFDANDMAVTLAIALPIAALLIDAGGVRRWIAVAYLPCALFAILLSGSRGALLAAGAGAVAFLLLSVGDPRFYKLLPVVVVVALVAAVASENLPDDVKLRYQAIPDEASGGTFTGRTVLWTSAVHAFTSHEALGVGAAAFPAFHERFEGWSQVVHNTPLSVAAELGIIGLALFYGALATSLGALTLMPLGWRRALFSILAIWFVGSLSLTWEYRKTTWFLMSAVLCAAAARTTPERAPGKEPALRERWA